MSLDEKVLKKYAKSDLEELPRLSPHNGFQIIFHAFDVAPFNLNLAKDGPNLLKEMSKSEILPKAIKYVYSELLDKKIDVLTAEKDLSIYREAYLKTVKEKCGELKPEKLY